MTEGFERIPDRTRDECGAEVEPLPPGAALTEARRKAWETRRAKYGPQGHNGYTLRPSAPLTAGPDDLVIVVSNIGGWCPVQAEGTINGTEFYFRARGQAWRMNIGGEDVVCAPAWSYWAPYGQERFDAGYMPLVEAKMFIAMAAGLWAAGGSGSTSVAVQVAPPIREDSK